MTIKPAEIGKSELFIVITSFPSVYKSRLIIKFIEFGLKHPSKINLY